MKNKEQNKFNYDPYPWDPAADLVEVILDDPGNDFLKIKETLTRIGITNNQRKKELQQLCHIFYKDRKYFIVHYKELLIMDYHNTNLTYHDIERRNRIVSLLADWGLISLTDMDQIADKSKISSFKIIPYRDRQNWNLVSNYSFNK